MKRNGLSFLELLLVVTILGIVAAVIIPRISDNSDTAKSRICDHNCGQINAAVERYRVLTGTWPSANLSELDGVAEYFPDGLPTCPVSEDAYELDITGGAYRVNGHTNGNHSP